MNKEKKKEKLQPWKESEIKVSELFGFEHLGGPGKPDGQCGCEPDTILEVKDFRRSVNAGDVYRVLDKNWALNKKTILAAINNCSENAKKLAEENPNLKLFCNLKSILNDMESGNEGKSLKDSCKCSFDNIEL